MSGGGDVTAEERMFTGTAAAVPKMYRRKSRVFIFLALQVGGWTQSLGRKLKLNLLFAHSQKIKV